MTVSAVMPSKNNAALPEVRRPSDSEALSLEEADLRNRQDPVSATAVAGIAKLSAEPLRPQQVALATNSQNDSAKFYTDTRSGIIFATSGAYAGIIINKATGVPLAEGLSITPGTFGKDVAIIPISNFNPSSLVGNDRIAKTAAQIGLNEATAVAGIQAAHLLQKTSWPVTAPPGTTKKIIYLASAFVPLALEGKKEIVDYLKSKNLINDSGKPGTRVEDWGQWTARYVPDSVAIGAGVSAAVTPTVAFNSIKDALKNGQPLDARMLFKAGVNTGKAGGLGFAVPILQSLLARAAVNYPGATNSAVVDGVVNGVTGQSITNLSKKIFTDPKQRQAVTEIKDQARFRQVNGEAAGDARYGTKTEQAAANAATAKQDAAALKKLPLGQKLENIRGQTGQYGRSVLIGVAIEVAPHYLSVEYNLNSRINNRSVRDMSPHQAADTVKAIDEVLRNPLVGDGKAISNVVINLGKLIGKDLSKINLWGSPEFINNLNDRKIQIYRKYPNLDLNSPAPKRGSSIPSNQEVKPGQDGRIPSTYKDPIGHPFDVNGGPNIIYNDPFSVPRNSGFNPSRIKPNPAVQWQNVKPVQGSFDGNRPTFPIFSNSSGNPFVDGTNVERAIGGYQAKPIVAPRVIIPRGGNQYNPLLTVPSTGGQPNFGANMPQFGSGYTGPRVQFR